MKIAILANDTTYTYNLRGALLRRLLAAGHRVTVISQLRGFWPESFGEMVRLAEAISAPFPHVRVDLYNVDGLIRFGELTFFNASGYMLYEPDCFDREIGDRFSLPQRRERPGGGAS